MAQVLALGGSRIGTFATALVVMVSSTATSSAPRAWTRIAQGHGQTPPARIATSTDVIGLRRTGPPAALLAAAVCSVATSLAWAARARRGSARLPKGAATAPRVANGRRSSGARAVHRAARASARGRSIARTQVLAVASGSAHGLLSCATALPAAIGILGDGPNAAGLVAPSPGVWVAGRRLSQIVLGPHRRHSGDAATSVRASRALRG